MILSLIAAKSENNAIGINNQLPWYLPEDLKFFKRHTIGKPVLMGRKTFESLGKPLPGRLNIVLSQNTDIVLPEGVLLYSDINSALDRLQKEDATEGFVIGGSKVFEMAMPLIDRMYITQVHTDIENADAFFPSIDHTHWKLIWQEQHAADENHKYAYTFEQYEHIGL
jgi:dihydrofolate reductase